MKKVFLFALVLLVSLPLAAASWKDVSLIDNGCSEHAAKDPDAHTKSCALKCAKSGFAIISEGKVIKLDDKGNELALEALKKSSATDHLRANVEGEVKDDVLHVTSLTLSE